jgi:hypothetical protein
VTTTAAIAPSPAQVGQVPPERAAALAARLLAGHRERRDRKPATAAAFGRALAATAPGSEHGQLLAAALRPAKWEDRSLQQRLVFGMARRGETPTARALESRLGQLEERRAHRERLRGTAASIAGRDAGKAGAFIAGTLGDTGQDPTWTELATAMGWPRKPYGLREGIIRSLAEAGWLQVSTEPRSLRPGPKSTETETETGSA